MRDDKLCPTCGADLIWKGNVLEGRLVCQHCAQVETISEPAELARLKEEEDWEDAVDANIKRLNKGKSFEDREFDDPTVMTIAGIDWASTMPGEWEQHIDFTAQPPWGHSGKPAKLQLRTGTQPADCTEDSGTLLGEVSLPPDWERYSDLDPIIDRDVFERKYMLTGSRQSGRTHGMVLRALEQLSKGESVVILVHHPRMVGYVAEILSRLGLECIQGHRFKVPYLPAVLTVRPVTFSPKGYIRSLKVFVDHAVYEQQDRDRSTMHALNEWWSRYDLQS